MGGFAYFALDDGGEVSQTPVKLTSRGVRFLMEHEPDLIPDRSKSSSLGNMLLFFQVAWFCLSCASRLGEHLPLSLLEVTTLAHGLCTLASYAARRPKPQNIDEPTWISMEGERAREALSLLRLVSENNWLGLSLSANENTAPTALDSTSVLAREAAPRYLRSDGDSRKLYAEPGRPLKI